MSEPEPTYGAGEDIPGTPAPFPFVLASLASAVASAMLSTVALFGGFGVPLVLALIPAVAWLLLGATRLMDGAWKGFVLGLPLVLAPWLLAVMLAHASF